MSHAPRLSVLRPPPELVPAPRRHRHTAKGERTRSTIIDAAEQLFAERGYDGVALREIIALAGVQMGQLQHYFPSKEAMFVGVLERRVAEVVLAYGAAVTALAQAAQAGQLGLRAVVRATMTVARAWQAGDDTGRHRYLRMLALSTLSFNQPDYVARHGSAFQPLNDTIIAYLGRLYPQAPAQRRLAAFYFIESNLLSLYVNIDSLFTRSGIQRSPDAVEHLFDELEEFLVGGVQHLLSPILCALAPDGT